LARAPHVTLLRYFCAALERGGANPLALGGFALKGRTMSSITASKTVEVDVMFRTDA
jgi:hypothetical protein